MAKVKPRRKVNSRVRGRSQIVKSHSKVKGTLRSISLTCLERDTFKNIKGLQVSSPAEDVSLLQQESSMKDFQHIQSKILDIYDVVSEQNFKQVSWSH